MSRPSPISGRSPATPDRATPTGTWSPRRRTSSPLAAVCAAIVLAACAARPPEPEKLVLSSATFDELPGWAADRHGDALGALRASCSKLAALADDAPLDPALSEPRFGRVRDWRAPCAAAAAVDPAAARAYFERWFLPYAAANKAERDGMFTGYYEPELRVARRRDSRFAVPIHGRPADLVMVELGQFRPDWRGQRTAGRVVEIGRAHV